MADLELGGEGSGGGRCLHRWIVCCGGPSTTAAHTTLPCCVQSALKPRFTNLPACLPRAPPPRARRPRRFLKYKTGGTVSSGGCDNTCTADPTKWCCMNVWPVTDNGVWIGWLGQASFALAANDTTSSDQFMAHLAWGDATQTPTTGSSYNPVNTGLCLSCIGAWHVLRNQCGHASAAAGDLHAGLWQQSVEGQQTGEPYLVKLLSAPLTTLPIACLFCCLPFRPRPRACSPHDHMRHLQLQQLWPAATQPAARPQRRCTQPHRLLSGNVHGLHLQQQHPLAQPTARPEGRRRL